MARNKTERIALRVSKTERDALYQRASEARMGISEYIVALSEQKKIVLVDGVPDLCIQITKIGTNINQIARVVNQTRSFSSNQSEYLQDELIKLHNILSKILDEIYDAKDHIEV